MGNPAKECQFCEKRYVGCHANCETGAKIRAWSEKVRRNRIKDLSYSDYFFRDAQVRMKRGH